MKARTRLALLLAASAPLASCVSPPPPMEPDPELAASERPYAEAPSWTSPGEAAPASARRDPADPPLPAPRRRASSPLASLGDNLAVTAILGRRSLDDDFEPAEDQLAYGLEIDGYDEFSLVGFEAGFLYSDDDDSDGASMVDASILELYAGVRKTFTAADGRLHPYLSGGVSFLNVDVESSGPDTPTFGDEDTFGGYFRGGIYYMATDVVRVGFDYRLLFGSDLDDGADADYDLISLTLGASL